jgi:hypothetical protein
MSIPLVSSNLTDEARAILYLSRTVMDSQNKVQLRELLDRNLDWESVVRLAETHGVLPLVHRNLSNGLDTKIPAAVWNKLSNQFHAVVQTNLIFIAELLHLLDLFKNEGIHAVPLRGPVMAACLYGDVALRQPGDLDLLVRQRHVLQVKEILVSRGYCPFFPWPRDEGSVFSRGEYAFVRNPGNIMVDLHWKTKGLDFAIPNPPSLWNRLQTVLVQGHAIPVLSWEDQLLLMSVHGAKHNWRRLIWLSDVAELVRISDTLDWDGLLDQAKSIGILRILVLAVVLANACFQTDLPEQFRKEAENDPLSGELASRFLEILFHHAAEPSPAREDPLLLVRCMDRRRHQVRYLLQRTFMPTAWTPGDQSFQSRVPFLQYFMRPLQMTKTYALPFIRRHHGKTQE